MQPNFTLYENTDAVDSPLLDDRFVDKEELATRLCVSVRTIEKNSKRIVGRVKVGKAVRYYLPEIYKTLLNGKNLLKKK